METIKSAKVTQVSGNGKWDSQQYGTFYKFEIVFDNGDSGQYMSKEPEQNKFKVGDEASYTITSKDVNGKLYYNKVRVDGSHRQPTPKRKPVFHG
jgi:hypothetical protein